MTNFDGQKTAALIGRTLKHSYSAPIHKLLTGGAYEYVLKELAEDGIEAFLRSEKYIGFNVTIPYKKTVLQYLDETDESVGLCGAVNTIVADGDGRLKGYNTDIEGFEYLLNYNRIDVRGKKAVILGDGGTTATVRAALNGLGVGEIAVVSRRGVVSYDNYAAHCGDADIIINASPVGMYPENGECLVDLTKFKKLEAVVDVIYNPLITKIGFLAKERGIKYCNGLMMLVAQAKYASELFLGRKLDDASIERVTNDMIKIKRNVVLVGMPGCGKSRIGRLVAERAGREFVDTDAEIESKRGESIPSIFRNYGEKYFRDLESQTAAAAGKKSGAVISCGGGILLRPENYRALKQNALIIYIERDLNLLPTAGRPLSRGRPLLEIYNERKPLYEGLSDARVKNDSTLDNAANKIIGIINA
ncbi:MAG: hypothetical protein LBQ40_05495 [Clostridiales bacterium]|jgi:shikimate dehydrogenase|nr:hypothetical protein [Clostridiales bacterium]